MFSLRQAFADFFNLVPEAELAQAHDHLRSLTARWTRAVAILMVVSVVALWPSDAVIFRDSPAYRHALGVWRAVLSSTSFLLAVGLTYWLPVRRNPVEAFIVAAAIVMGASGFAVGQLGGIDNPFFYAVYPIPAITVALLCPLPQRVAANVTIVGAYLAGFVIGIQPQTLPIGFAGPVIFLVTASMGMIFLGHVVYRLVGSNFCRHQRLENLIDSQKRDLAFATREALTAHVKVRERVLRDLHDNVGPVITALHLDTFAARQGLQRSSDPQTVAAEYLDTVDAHAVLLKKLIRDTLRDLDPYGIERGLLTDVIANTFAELGIPDTHQLECDLDAEINELPADLKQTLHLMVRECANNAVKHARAARITVDAGIADGILYFLFEDDGQGCDLAALENLSNQYGLSGLRLRAIDAGGQAAISSAPGKGMRVEVKIPLCSDVLVNLA